MCLRVHSSRKCESPRQGKAEARFGFVLVPTTESCGRVWAVGASSPREYSSRACSRSPRLLAALHPQLSLGTVILCGLIEVP